MRPLLQLKRSIWRVPDTQSSNDGTVKETFTSLRMIWSAIGLCWSTLTRLNSGLLLRWAAITSPSLASSSASGYRDGCRRAAHSHPKEADVARRPDPRRPTFTFRLMIPRPGRYVIWSEVSLAGRETFAPFWFDVGG